MAVNGYAAAQDVADLKVSTAALAVAMGQRVNINEAHILAAQAVAEAIPGQLEELENSIAPIAIAASETVTAEAMAAAAAALERENHTGTQAMSTVSGLEDELAGIADSGLPLIKFGLNKAGLEAGLAAAMATGRTLLLPPGVTTIAGWDTPFAQTAPLRIAGQGMGLSTLAFTSPTASFIHILSPIFEAQDFTVTGLTANTSGNGGGFAYCVSADTIADPVSPKFRRLRFDTVKAPINIEKAFDGPEIQWCEYLNGTGHGFRFGNGGGLAEWAAWKNLTAVGWKVRNLSSVGPGNNVYAGLAYGLGHQFDWIDIDGIVGTMDRNGNAWPTEAGGLHTQAANVTVGSNNKSKNISGAEIMRHVMAKGAEDATNYNLGFWDADCGGNGEGLAWYCKSGHARLRCYDPGVAGVTVGTLNGTDYAYLDVDLQGTNRAGVSGMGVSWDDGRIKIVGRIAGFVKGIAVSSSAGEATPQALVVDAEISGGNGPGIDVYLGVSVNEVDIRGGSAIANNSNCRWVRGLNSSVTVNKLTMRGALTNVGGYGTVLNTITINSVDIEQHVSGVTTPGRELTNTAIIKAGRVRSNIGGATTTATPLTALTLPVPDGSSLLLSILGNAKDGTDSAQFERSFGFGAAGGAAVLNGSSTGLQVRSAGATGWDADATNSSGNAIVRLTGAASKSVQHRATVTAAYSG